MNISLVVPLLNEAGSVEALLDSVLAQDRAPDEVVIVDAGSTDGTASLVQSWADAHGCGNWVQVILSPGATPGVGRNVGARHARGEWIAFTDGGIRLRREWTTCLSAAAGPGIDVVLGSFDPEVLSLFQQCAAIAYVPAKESWGGRGPSAVSIMMRKSFFEGIGGFPPFRASEDLVFFERMEKAGARVSHAPGAIAEWQTAPGAVATYRRFADYSYHNLLAGRGRYWHIGVLRLYILLATAVLVAWWAGVGAVSAAGLPLFYLARAGKSAWKKRRSFPFSTVNPMRLACTALLLILIDIATLAGAIRGLRGSST